MIISERKKTIAEKTMETAPSSRRKVIVSVKGGMVVDVVAPSDIDVYIRDYDTPIAIDRGVEDEKAEIYSDRIGIDEEGDEYVEEVW